MKATARLVASILLLAASGCGGGTETTTDSSAREGGGPGVPKVAAGPTGEVAVGGGGRISVVGDGASEISVKTVPRGLGFEQRKITIKAAETKLHLENPQGKVHDLDLEDADGKLIADMETIGGGYADVPIRYLPPGKYTFYCSVPGHREAGMEGTVIVEE
jgi:uncharacterized cupredoxin-like copper-binding protein